MLNLQFYFFSFSLLPILFILNTLALLVIDYLFYVKTFLKKKTKKTKKKTNTPQTFNIHSAVINNLLITINFLFFFNKNSNYLFLDCKYFYNNKYILFLFLFSSLVTIITNYLYKYYYNTNYTINYTSYIGPLCTGIIYFALFSNNFLTLVIYLEILSYIFYLQFIQIFNKLKTKQKNNFYLDSLLIYYWLNCISSILLIYSIILLYYYNNTTNFLQLTYFNNINIFYFYLGFSLKLSITGFHFLKAEVYKNLKIDSIITFSFFSVIVYISLLKFVMINLNLVINFNFFSIMLFLTLFLFLMSDSLKVTNLILFFGYSVALNITLCSFLIIN